ncbi:MAG: hypothetical protein DBX58_06355 [Clostridiales bacterium]|nr:MAG: hypothetical protein DBX58_06355 [Clostridiales bacterium]
MAKNDKYMQYTRSRKKTQLDVNLQQLAVEYSKLLNKRYCYIFSGGIEIQFQFKMENFYHMLGFHKLTDVTVVKMVEAHKLKKEDFFKYVKDGKITMNSTDTSIVGDFEDKVLNIQNSNKKSELGEIKAHRFRFFSETQVLELLKNDPIIDFDKEECETYIEADKIFFKLIAEKSRNLNLFIGYDEALKRYFISTFFVESEKDKFLLKKDGSSQPLLKILSRKVIDTRNNTVIDFFIKWHNVREEFINEPFYRGQTRLKTWINNKHISSIQVVNEINTQRKLLAQYKEDVEQLRVKLNVLQLIVQLDIPEEKEEAQLKLMEYNIDADSTEELAVYKQYDIIQVKNDKLRIESKSAALENKLQKHEKYLPDIKELELQEVLRVYQIYLPEIKLDRERVTKILELHDVFDETLYPEEFRKIYNETQ